MAGRSSARAFVAIESTEVTVQEFTDFKAHFGADAGAPWEQCPGRVTLGPGAGCMPSAQGASEPGN